MLIMLSSVIMSHFMKKYKYDYPQPLLISLVLIMASDGCNGHQRPLLKPRACNRANMKKAIH
jgi:hypothetical protein